MRGVDIKWIGGNCPVQAEGSIDGRPFYFRARGIRWSISIGEGSLARRGDDRNVWFYEETYGTSPYGAGYMDIDVATDLIHDAALLYRLSLKEKYEKILQHF